MRTRIHIQLRRASHLMIHHLAPGLLLGLLIVCAFTLLLIGVSVVGIGPAQAQ